MQADTVCARASGHTGSGSLPEFSCCGCTLATVSPDIYFRLQAGGGGKEVKGQMPLLMKLSGLSYSGRSGRDIFPQDFVIYFSSTSREPGKSRFLFEIMLLRKKPGIL